MGCLVEWEESMVTLTGPECLRSIRIDMNDMSDVVPTLAICALFAEGETQILNVAHMRLKECDRLQVLVSELRKVGADLDETPEGLVVQGSPQQEITKSELDPHNDHRMAMAFSLLSTKVDGLQILNSSCVEKTFPHYFSQLERLLCPAP